VQVIDDVSSGKSRPIKKTFEDLLFSIHKASREDDDGEAEAEAYEAYDEDDNEFGASRFAHQTVRPKKLQKYVSITNLFSSLTFSPAISSKWWEQVIDPVLSVSV
jgi:hypothetical protein